MNENERPSLKYYTIILVDEYPLKDDEWGCVFLTFKIILGKG